MVCAEGHVITGGLVRTIVNRLQIVLSEIEFSQQSANESMRQAHLQKAKREIVDLTNVVQSHHQMYKVAQQIGKKD